MEQCDSGDMMLFFSINIKQVESDTLKVLLPDSRQYSLLKSEFVIWVDFNLSVE
jgi:hypothetical protein